MNVSLLEIVALERPTGDHQEPEDHHGRGRARAQSDVRTGAPDEQRHDRYDTDAHENAHGDLA